MRLFDRRTLDEKHQDRIYELQDQLSRIRAELYELSYDVTKARMNVTELQTATPRRIVSA